MEATLLQADRVLVSKVDYRFGSPGRGDIVVFNPTTDTAKREFGERRMLEGFALVQLASHHATDEELQELLRSGRSLPAD